MIWVNKYDDGSVEGAFTEGGKLSDARVKFRFRDKFGSVVSTTIEIPVLSLLEMSYVLDMSLKTYRLTMERKLNNLKGGGERYGKKD